jgi:hypothetical protein
MLTEDSTENRNWYVSLQIYLRKHKSVRRISFRGKYCWLPIVLRRRRKTGNFIAYHGGVRRVKLSISHTPSSPPFDNPTKRPT